MSVMQISVRRRSVIIVSAMCFQAGFFFALSATIAQGDDSKRVDVVDIGSRLELFVDDWLIGEIKSARRRLHQPTHKEVAVVFDAPAEGNTCTYVRVFKDGDIFRMYYRGSHFDWKTKKSTHQVVCYAESKDAIHWTKPDLNLFEFNGSKKNNIVWMGLGEHNFSPFRDMNPNCAADARYKALGSHGKTLLAFASPDAIHWRVISDKPVITKGAFDSQNLGFWDTHRGRYVEFHRGARNGIRDIMTSTSSDFRSWTEPKFIDQGDAEPQHLYTNATIAYDRAPHIFLAFPKRFVPSRKPAYNPKPKDNYPGVSDGVLMSSRDGVHWNRWDEAFLRPGKNVDRWWQRNNMIAWGVLPTNSDLPGHQPELSLYSTENYYIGPCRLRRHTIRLDGFVSVYAPYKGGEFTTRPLRFDGNELVINFSSSAAGSIRCEIQDAAGKPIPGFALSECPDIYGDRVEHVVNWKSGSNLKELAKKTIRLRFVLKDADLYSLRFRKKS